MLSTSTNDARGPPSYPVYPPPVMFAHTADGSGPRPVSFDAAMKKFDAVGLFCDGVRDALRVAYDTTRAGTSETSASAFFSLPPEAERGAHNSTARMFVELVECQKSANAIFKERLDDRASRLGILVAQLVLDSPWALFYNKRAREYDGDVNDFKKVYDFYVEILSAFDVFVHEHLKSQYRALLGDVKAAEIVKPAVREFYTIYADELPNNMTLLDLVDAELTDAIVACLRARDEGRPHIMSAVRMQWAHIKTQRANIHRADKALDAFVASLEQRWVALRTLWKYTPAPVSVEACVECEVTEAVETAVDDTRCGFMRLGGFFSRRRSSAVATVVAREVTATKE